MSQAYDRQGQPITLEEAGRLHKDHKYVVVKQETVGVYWISTVWLGYDHRHGSGPPVIFETMVFERGPAGIREEYRGLRTLVDDTYHEWNEVDGRRYCTEAEALAGHAAMVEEWSRPR